MKIKVDSLLIVLALSFFLFFSLAAQSSTLVNGSFYDSDLREVICTIAAQTGVTIVMDDAVTGTVSVEFNQTPLGKALATVLSPGEYTFRKIDDYYVVSTTQISNPAFKSISSTSVIKPRYIDISRINELLSPDLAPYVKIDRERNLLLITGPPIIARRIENIVSSIDKPLAHIMVQVLVVEIAKERGIQLGINWNWQWIGKQGESEEILVEGLAVGYASKNIMATISNLAAKGELKILSNPRVLTFDGTSAKVELETQQYFQLLGGPPEAAYFKLEPVTARTAVEVKPRLTQEKDVFLDVKILVEDLAQELNIPRVTTRRARTTIKTRSDQTIAIAGLSEEVQREIKSKVWGLGDIPVVDILFSKRYATSRKTELIIFITPSVLEKELPSTKVALAAATWNTWSPKPRYGIKSERFSPKIYLDLSSCFSEVPGENQYKVEIGRTSRYGWNLSGSYGLFEQEHYKLSFFEAGFQKEMIKIKGNLYIRFSYRRRESKSQAGLEGEDFQQNVYSFSLREVNPLTLNLQVMGSVGLTYLEEEGGLSLPIYTLSGGPIYYLRKGLSLSGRYDYIWSRQSEYQQKRYAVEINCIFWGGRGILTAGYYDSDQESIRYMVGMEPPSKGYYAGVKIFLR